MAGQIAYQDVMTDQPDTHDATSLFRWFTEVAILAQLSGRVLEGVLPSGMTFSQFGVLNHLARTGNRQTPNQLAVAMQVTKGTMTNTLGHLERAGHVVIVPSVTDKRSKYVELSQIGRTAREVAIAAVSPELAAIARQISPEEISTSLAVLEHVRRVLDERRN